MGASGEWNKGNDCMKTTSCLAVLVLLSAQAAMALTPEEKSKITNFFYHMKGLQAAEDAKPEARPDHPTGGLASFKTFPFEAYSHLEIRDLMRAAREGITDAEKKLANADPEVLARQIRENVAFVFEFLPHLIVDADDLRFIRYVLEDPGEHMVLRRYVMDQLMPSNKPRTQTQLFLHDHIAGDRDSYKRLLGSMITLSFEQPEFRERAMELLYLASFEDYVAFFQEDANIAQYMETHGRTVMPRDLGAIEGLELSNRTRARFKQQTEDFVGLAMILARSFDPLENHPERTQLVARSLIERILNQVPLENPDTVRALLPAEGGEE